MVSTKYLLLLLTINPIIFRYEWMPNSLLYTHPILRILFQQFGYKQLAILRYLKILGKDQLGKFGLNLLPGNLNNISLKGRSTGNKLISHNAKPPHINLIIIKVIIQLFRRYIRNTAHHRIPQRIRMHSTSEIPNFDVVLILNR